MLHQKGIRNKKAHVKKCEFEFVSFNAVGFALIYVFPHFLQEWISNINTIIFFFFW